MKDKEQSVLVLEIYIPSKWQINHIFSQIKETSIILYRSVHDRSASHASVTPCCKNHLFKPTVIKRTVGSQMSALQVLNLQKHGNFTKVTRDVFHLDGLRDHCKQ